MPLTISSTSKNADYRAQKAIEKFLQNGFFKIIDVQEDHIEFLAPDCQWVVDLTTIDSVSIGGVNVNLATVTLTKINE
jgi:hypothetical protein